MCENRNYVPTDFFFPIETKRLNFSMYGYLKYVTVEDKNMIMLTISFIRVLILKVLKYPKEYNSKIYLNSKVKK